MLQSVYNVVASCDTKLCFHFSADKDKDGNGDISIIVSSANAHGTICIDLKDFILTFHGNR